MEPFDVVVYGNPFRERLTFRIQTFNQQQAQVGLVDLNGKVIHQSLQQTNSHIELNENIATGIYLLKVQTSFGQKILRVFKMD